MIDLEFFAERQLMGQAVALYGFSHAGKAVQAVKPVQMEGQEEGAYSEPAMVLTVNAAQRLMDELWRAGLRPTEGTGSAGALAATERHLKDMQRIAFSLLEPRQ